MRGFEYGTLGPYENFPSRGPRPAGGYKYHTYNFEYLYRVNDPLRLVLFADAGKAYGYRGDVRLRQAALQRRRGDADLPAGLPVPAAVHLRDQPGAGRHGDEFEGFQFTIGNTF